jgi:transcriptional regulator GlxA family with amidase domain
MRDILIIVPEEGLLFEAAGIADIFGQANEIRLDAALEPAYQVTIATTQPHRVVHGRAGLNLLADQRLVDLDPGNKRDTVFVTSRGSSPAERTAVADWLRQAAPRTRRMASVCAGALILAETGLLDGRQATTHWKKLDEMQERFPAVRVERGPIYVQDGPFWTSAGASSGFDMALALVEEDLGFEMARDVAQCLVMYLRRPGGQSQFSRFLSAQVPAASPLAKLQVWILENLGCDLSVERLAERVAMSPRNFSRVFSRETGLTPAKYVEEVRIEAARHRLEQGSEGMEEVARATGFSNALGLRRAFERQLQLTPSDYRERFCSKDLVLS